MRTYEPRLGECITETCKALETMTAEHNKPVQAKFNDVTITAHPGMTAGDLEKSWREETDRRQAEYEASPEYKQRLEESARRDSERKAALSTALAIAPPMEFADEATWKEFAEANTDPYGGCVVRYAETWARLMQSRIDNGEAVAECAEETSRIADDEGITGFMYGCAVATLAKTWKHGEDLRRWHNLKTQIRDEGEKANESGGVLNPALLSIMVGSCH